MSDVKSFSEIRRDYGDLSLNEEKVQTNPIAQFKLWFQEALNYEKPDPTAMVLSTVDEKGWPDSRVVLLKEINSEEHFIFYTNYQSAKALQIQAHPQVALNFYWPECSRQVRIRGTIKKNQSSESDAYFASRPFKSQLSAVASPQSQIIENRAYLEQAIFNLEQKYNAQSIDRPSFWGGYEVIPEFMEFWQGRDNRLHDRIQYYKDHDFWQFHRLAP